MNNFVVVIVEALNKSDDIKKDIDSKIHQLTDSVKQFVSNASLACNYYHHTYCVICPRFRLLLANWS